MIPPTMAQIAWSKCFSRMHVRVMLMYAGPAGRNLLTEVKKLTSQRHWLVTARVDDEDFVTIAIEELKTEVT